MTRTEIMRRLRQEMEEKEKAEKAVLTITNNIERLRLELEFANDTESPAVRSEIEKFIDRNADRLRPEDLKHLERSEHDAKATGEYLFLCERVVKNKLNDRKLRPGSSDRPGRGGSRWIDSISAVELWLNGET